MLRFLSQARTAPIKTLVLGNQALDVDSFCSSILTAYLETIKGRECTPYIPIKRSELRLRRDVEMIMKELKIDPMKLLFADDYEPSEETKLILVDHNSPFVKGIVTGVIDHHEPEQEHEPDKVDPLVLSMSASSVSLVLKYYNEHIDLVKAFEDEPALASLAYAPLIIDSGNFFKMKPEDILAYQFLSQFIKYIPDTISFNSIKEARNNIEGLTTTDLLHKDYKQWGGIGISTLPRRFHKLDLVDLSECMNKVRELRGLKVLAAMAASKNGRDLAYSGPKGFDIVGRCPTLKLIAQKEYNGVQFFSQMEASFSRKQVAPILRAAFAQWEKEQL